MKQHILYEHIEDLLWQRLGNPTIAIPLIVYVRPCDIQTHSGFRLQPNNMAHSVPKPSLQAAFRPIEQMIFINSYYTTSSGSHLVICFPNKKVIAQPYYLSVAR